MEKEHNIIHYLITAVYFFVKGLLSSFIWTVFGFIGLLVLKKRISPWDILIGLPMLLIGGGLVVNNMTSLTLSIFSPKHNQGVCILCKRENFKDQAKLKEILGIN